MKRRRHLWVPSHGKWRTTSLSVIAGTTFAFLLHPFQTSQAEAEKEDPPPPPFASKAPPAASSLSLAEAAQKIAATQIPKDKGGIVTAEAKGETPPVISLNGTIEVAPGTPPEKILFEIGSITKVFNGLLLAQAVVEGKTTLCTSLKRALGIHQEFTDPRVGAITLEQLVTHTSGLPRLPPNLNEGADPADPYAHFDRDLLCAALKSTKLEHDGPFPQAYSNFGAGLLGEVLAVLYNKPWAELVAEKITGPLGMKDTAIELSDEQKKRFAPAFDGKKSVPPWRLNVLAGAGALRSTAHDLLIFGKALNHPEKTPLHQAIKLLLEPRGQDQSIGLSIFISELDQKRLYEHDGGTGGYRSSLRVQPDSDLVQVVLINNAAVEAAHVFSATRQETARQHDSDIQLNENQLDVYVGIYGKERGNGSFTILRQGNQLMARLSGQPFFPVFPHEKADRFFYKKVAAELQFHRGPHQAPDAATPTEEQAVTLLTLFQNGRQIRFQKSPAPVPKIRFRQAEALVPYAGTYELGVGHAFQLTVHEATLYAKLDDQPSLPVFETRDHWFDYDVIKASLEFERDADGSIIALKLHQNGLVQRAVKKAK